MRGFFIPAIVPEDMKSQMHDDVLLAPFIMINIGTDVGPVMTNYSRRIFLHI